MIETDFHIIYIFVGSGPCADMDSQEYGHEQHAFRMALQAPDERQASGRIERAPQYPCGGAWQNAVSSPTPHSRQKLRHHCAHISMPHEDDERADAAFESRKLIVPALHHEHHREHAKAHDDEEAERWRQKYISMHNGNVMMERKLQRLKNEKHAQKKQVGHDSFHATTLTDAHTFAWTPLRPRKKAPSMWHARDLNSNSLW